MKKTFNEFAKGLEELDINEQLSLYNDYEFNYIQNSTMRKNNQIKNLKEPIPAKIRLQVYKEALAFIEEGKKIYNVYYTDGLCLILPIILWGMDSMFALAPDGYCWSYRDATTAFIEFKERDITRIFKAKNTLLVRKNLLKKWIKKIENENNN